MRTRKAIYNLTGALLSHFFSMVLAFITQAIFIKSLGTEYMGLSGLMNNIFSMLAVTEFGVGSAIVFSLYKPLQENNQEKIKSLLKFYKKCYHIIAIIILILSIIIFPLLPSIIGKTTIKIKIVYLVYFLFMIDIIFSYLLTYKRSILQADQKQYNIDIIHILYLILLNLSQIIILIKFKNFILFLLIKILFRVMENLIINLYVDKKYKYLKEPAKDISLEDKDSIIQKVKGLFIHKIGAFLVAGTDNILISIFLGIKMVGLYSNYFLIINAIQTVINQVFSSFKSSIGNLLVFNSYDKNYEVYKNMQFLNFWFAMMSTVGIYVVMDTFITLWIGKNYILDNNILVSLSICNYVYISKLCISNFKDAAGIFYEDRKIPIIESITNVVTSIFLVKLIGLSGIFYGTTITYLITHFYTYPKIVYKNIFKQKYCQYFLDIIKYLLFTILIIFITKYISNIIIFKNCLINLIYKIIVVLMIPNGFIIIFFHNTKEFKYYKETLKNIKLGRKNK